MARTTQESSCRSKEHTEKNISHTSLTLPKTGTGHSTRENTRAVMHLHGTFNFVGVASVSFH